MILFGGCSFSTIIVGEITVSSVVNGGGVDTVSQFGEDLGVVVKGRDVVLTYIGIGRFLDNIVEVFEGKGKLFRYGLFVNFLLLSPFLFFFSFNHLKLSTSINDSQNNDVLDTCLILMYFFTGVILETILPITALNVHYLYLNSGQIIDDIPLMALLLNRYFGGKYY